MAGLMLHLPAAPTGAAPCMTANRNVRVHSKSSRPHAPLTSTQPTAGLSPVRNVRRPHAPEPAVVSFQYAATEVETSYGNEDESPEHLSSSASKLAERHLKLFRPVSSPIPRGGFSSAPNSHANAAGDHKTLSTKALWNAIRNAHSTSVLSKAICRNHAALKARHVSLALETLVALRQQKRSSHTKGSTRRAWQTQGLDAAQQKMLRTRHWESLRILEGHIVAHASSYSTRSLARALYCLAELRRINPSVFAAAETALVSRLDEFEAPHLATLLTTFFKAGVTCSSLRDSAELIVLQQRMQFQPKELASLLAGCTYAGQQHCSPDLQAYLEQQVISNSKENMDWAVSVSRLPAAKAPPPPHALLAALRDDLMLPSSERRILVGPQNLVAAAAVCVRAAKVAPARHAKSVFPENLLALLAEAAEALSEQCRPQQLAELSTHLCNLGCDVPTLLESLDTRSLLTADSFKPREIAMAAKVLSCTAGSSSPAAAGAVALLCDEAVRRGPDEFSSEQLAYLARACSVVGGHPEGLLSMVATSMAQNPAKVPMRSFAMTARALADVNHPNPEFFDCFAEQVLMRMPEMCSASLVETVHSLAKAGCYKLPVVLREIEGRAAKAARSLKPRQTLTLVRSYRRARVAAPLLLQAATSAARKREAEFSSKQLAQLLLAAVREGDSDSDRADAVCALRAALSRRLAHCSEDSSLTPQVLKFIIGSYLASGGADYATLQAAKDVQTELRKRAIELQAMHSRRSGPWEGDSDCNEAATVQLKHSVTVNC